jgi:hypothetical protein
MIQRPSGLLDNCAMHFHTYNYAIQIPKEIQLVKYNRNLNKVLLILLLGLTACNLPSNQTATPDPYEAAALTVTALAGTEQANQTATSPTATVTVLPTPVNTVTSAPPLPTVVQVTATPSGTFFIVDVGANCRSGPGTGYDKVTSFAQGTFVTLVGHNTDNSWWYVLTGSTNCWISASTGHTSGSTASLPLVAAPPTPTAIAGSGPTLGDPVALVAELSYPSNCTSNTMQVAIRVTDAGKGINSVWLSYRYQGDGGYIGSWHTVTPNDNAAGGVNGFNYNIGVEAAGELGTQNGTFQYQFFAKDNSGNTSSYPNGSVLGLPIKYCP